MVQCMVQCMASAGKAALPLRTKYTEFASSRCFAITCFGAICSAQSLAPKLFPKTIADLSTHTQQLSERCPRPQQTWRKSPAGEYA